jgi:hypothetical protein
MATPASTSSAGALPVTERSCGLSLVRPPRFEPRA